MLTSANQDLAADPVSWRPATDFSRVVRVVDTRARGCRGLEVASHYALTNICQHLILIY